MTDICSQLCPESLSISGKDRALTERVKTQVFAELGLSHAPGRGKFFRTALLVAVMASLFVGGAFAISRYFMSIEKAPEENVRGYWTKYSEAGEKLEQQEHAFPDAGMIFNFTGPEEQVGVPEFRCFWLPEEPDAGGTDAEGWTGYLALYGEEGDFPYIIDCSSARSDGSRLVLNGDVTVIQEEYWDDWYVLQLSADYSGCKLRWPSEKANYILLFNEQSGALVTIGGTSDMETLEHIAREMEIRDSGKTTPENNMDAGIGQIDIGRG